MSKVTVAFGSFVLGICVSFVGFHTSTIVQVGFAQDKKQSPPQPPSIAIYVGDKEPTVPPIGPNMGSHIEIGGKQPSNRLTE